MFGFGDAAERVSDACNQAIVNGDRGEWIAFALTDGSVSGMPFNPRTYARRQDAVRAQGHSAADYGYIKVPWDGVTPRAAQVMVKLQRQIRDTDMQLIDPEVAGHDYPTDNRRESMPALDRRRALTSSRSDRRSPGGIIIPDSAWRGRP